MRSLSSSRNGGRFSTGAGSGRGKRAGPGGYISPWWRMGIAGWVVLAVSLLFLAGLVFTTTGWAGQGGPLQEKAGEKPGPKAVAVRSGPDLVVDKFWVETVMPGDRLPNGQTARRKYLYFVWKVRNIGDKVSTSTKLDVNCKVLAGPGSCPFVAESYGVGVLWPRPHAPNDPSGAQTFWNQKPSPVPTSSVKFRFVALVDPDNRVPEKNEGNNRLVSVFSSSSVKASKTAELGHVVKVRSPKIVVESVAVHPYPLKAGRAVDLSVNLKNKGSGPSLSGYKYRITCKVLSGGPACPVPDSTRTIPRAIKAGGSYTDQLLGAKAALAGKYRVSIFVPYNSMARPSFILVLDVAPRFKRGAVKEGVKRRPGLRRVPLR